MGDLNVDIAERGYFLHSSNFKAIMILAHDLSLSNKVFPVNSSTYRTIVKPTIHYIDSLTFLVEHPTVATKAFYKSV